MRRLFPIVLAAGLGLAAAAPSFAQPAPPPRPRLVVVVVTLDDVTQGQARYGRGLVESLGDARWGRFDYAAAPAAEAWDSCQDDRSGEALDHCIRFYARRAAVGLAHPLVVVALDDQPPGAKMNRGAGELSARCFGAGAAPADAAAQSTWLWPTALRIHGVNDLDRDKDALAACIAAAAREERAPPPG